jgi:hypothetical protein
MVNENSLTEKEWIVLNYFIEKDSQAIQKWLLGNKIKIEPYQHFIAYPAKIESDLDNVTRPTAGKACKKFLKIGIFNTEKKRPNFKGGETDYYSLKSDLQTIRQLVQLIMEKKDSSEIIKIIGNHYFMHNVNDSLVKEVLYEKHVKISRYLSFLEWDVKEGELIYNQHTEIIYKGLDNSELTFNNDVKRMINDFEDSQNRYEKSYLKRLHNSCNEFLEIYNDDSDDEMRYISNKFHVAKNRFLSENITRTMNELSIFIDLPVFNENISNEQMFEIKKMNVDLFKRYSNLQNYRSGFENHYNNFQYKNLILPLLSIIQTSPKALAEFLNGNWESFTADFDFNNNMKCEFISNLSLIAIKDILNTFQVPKNSIVKHAYLGKLPPNANPDTDITKSLRLKLKNLYEISLNLKFLISSETPSSSSIEINDFVNISSNVSFYLLAVKDITNARNLIIKLKDENDPVYSHIRNKLSYFVQNLILHYDNENTPSIEFQKTIIDGLNYALLRGDLYDEKTFSNVLSNKDIEKWFGVNVNLFDTNNFSKYYTNKMIYADPQEHIKIIEKGRYILEKTFPEEIEQEFY